MARPTIDPPREDRIHSEGIVDAYGPEEQAMGWAPEDLAASDMLVLIRRQSRNLAVPLY